MATIELKKVKKIYDNKVVAVHDFNLEIKDKEFVVFVGPSGCGKSTTLRMVAGLEEISEGTVAIDGRVVNDLPPKDRNIAMVFQNYALYPHLSVFDNIAFPLRLIKQVTPQPLEEGEKEKLQNTLEKLEDQIEKEEEAVTAKVTPLKEKLEPLEALLAKGGKDLTEDNKGQLDLDIVNLKDKIAAYKAAGEEERIAGLREELKKVEELNKTGEIAVSEEEKQQLILKKGAVEAKIEAIRNSKGSARKLPALNGELITLEQSINQSRRPLNDKEKDFYKVREAKLNKQLEKEERQGLLLAERQLKIKEEAKAKGLFPLSDEEFKNLKKEIAALRFKVEDISTRKLPTLYRKRNETKEAIESGVKLVHHKMSNDEIYQRVTSVAETLGITSYLARKPRALSGGQRQRVAIGRAMVRDSKVLLMDEPLSNLDAKLRNQMRAEIILLRKKIDATFIYVTHDQTEAMTLGDRIVIMKDGFVQQVGTPQEVFNTPANLFVAGFIGAPQMNFFKEAKLMKGKDGYYVELKGVKFPINGENAKLLEKGKVKEGEVILGVRPEHMNFSIKPSEASLECELVVSEMMGSELHLHLHCSDGSSIVTRVPTVNLTKEEMEAASVPGKKSYISFDGKVMHLFDKETESSLLHPELEYKVQD